MPRALATRPTTDKESLDVKRGAVNGETLAEEITTGLSEILESEKRTEHENELWPEVKVNTTGLTASKLIVWLLVTFGGNNML